MVCSDCPYGVCIGVCPLVLADFAALPKSLGLHGVKSEPSIDNLKQTSEVKL